MGDIPHLSFADTQEKENHFYVRHKSMWCLTLGVWDIWCVEHMCTVYGHGHGCGCWWMSMNNRMVTEWLRLEV